MGRYTLPEDQMSDDPKEVEVPDPSYQPTAAELREDLRVKNATFEEAAKSVVQPVKVRYVKPPGERLDSEKHTGAAKLTPEERSAIARRAAVARWHQPRST